MDEGGKGGTRGAMQIEDIKGVTKMSVKLLVQLYALLEQEKAKDQQELIQDFISELDLYIREFTQLEGEQMQIFEQREREQWKTKKDHIGQIKSFTPRKN